MKPLKGRKKRAGCLWLGDLSNDVVWVPGFAYWCLYVLDRVLQKTSNPESPGGTDQNSSKKSLFPLAKGLGKRWAHNRPPPLCSSSSGLSRKLIFTLPLGSMACTSVPLRGGVSWAVCWSSIHLWAEPRQCSWAVPGECPQSPPLTWASHPYPAATKHESDLCSSLVVAVGLIPWVCDLTSSLGGNTEVPYFPREGVSGPSRKLNFHPTNMLGGSVFHFCQDTVGIIYIPTWPSCCISTGVLPAK